jgi:RNA polymerase sigma-70 factor (ECF subfamily)
MSWPSTQLVLQSQTMDDEALASQGTSDPGAFGELYRRFLQRVYRYHMAHTGNEADAQDLTALTFLAALEGIGSYRATGSFGAWLFGIARRKMAQHFRSRRNEADLESAGELADRSPGLDVIVGQRLQLVSVSRALGGLSSERAEVIELCIFGNLAAGEAAQVLGKSEAAVKMLLLRGLRDLRARLVQTVEEK